MAVEIPDADGADDGGHRLGQLHVAVVGAGRIGAELVRTLGDLGVDRIDVFESNPAAADPLRGRCTVYDGDFWDELTLMRLRGYDFAICTVADRAARVRLNQKCLVANVNLLQAWMEGPLAIVGAYPFRMLRDCACFECDATGGATPTPLASLRLSSAATDTGVPTAIIAGGLAAALLARVAAGAHNAVARRATLDAVSGQGTSVELQRDPGCVRCRSLERPVPIVQTRNRWVPSGPVAATCPEALDQDVRLSDDIEGFPGGSCRVGALAEHFQGRPIPAKFALAEVGGRTICLDFEELRPDSRGAAPARTTAQRPASN